jgi:hypothetical protein
MFLSFSPAVSKDALKRMSATVRAWRLHRRTGFVNIHVLWRRRSGVEDGFRGWRCPRGAGDGIADRGHGIDAVFDRGGDVAADGQAVGGGVFAGESTGDVLLDLVGSRSRSARLFVGGIRAS